MTVRDTSLLAYKEILEKCNPDEQIVFEVILDAGPMSDKEILNYLRRKELAKCQPKAARRVWEINAISGRRNGLEGKNAIKDLGYFTSKEQKRPVHLWDAKYENRPIPPGWTRWEGPAPQLRKPPAQIKAERAERRARAEAPILERQKVSEAGRTLVEHRRKGRKKMTVSTAQGLLFG